MLPSVGEILPAGYQARPEPFWRAYRIVDDYDAEDIHYDGKPSFAWIVDRRNVVVAEVLIWQGVGYTIRESSRPGVGAHARDKYLTAAFGQFLGQKLAMQRECA